MLAVSHDAAWRIATPLIGFEVMPNGTGDAVAALFTAHWLESGDVARRSARPRPRSTPCWRRRAAMGERELQLVAAQDRLVAPPRRFTAEKL